MSQFRRCAKKKIATISRVFSSVVCFSLATGRGPIGCVRETASATVAAAAAVAARRLLAAFHR